MDTVQTPKAFNLLINASNQANLCSIKNTKGIQLNSILVFIEPYVLEQMEMEEMDIHINIDETGGLRINNTHVEAIEITPGIKVFGLLKTNT